MRLVKAAKAFPHAKFSSLSTVYDTVYTTHYTDLQRPFLKKFLLVFKGQRTFLKTL